MGNNYNGKIPRYDGGSSNVNHFLEFDESDDLCVDLSNDRKKSDEICDDILSKKRKDKLKNLFFPKVICLISLQPFYKEHFLILRQIYDYYLNKERKKIPIEKIILNLLCNIPMPPNGLFEISYKFNNESNENNNNEIKIKRHKCNEMKNIDNVVNFILSNFNVEKFLEIFKYSIYEIKTLIFSSNINSLCTFINGILSILFPFNYSFQVSSCVPNNAFDVLESISPYIFGINQPYKESFFSDNKIEINEVDLMIIDIDNKNIIIKTQKKENYPSLPKSLYKKLKSSIEDMIKKQKSLSKTKNKDELNLFSSIFFDFFLNIMIDYSNFLNRDYFSYKSKYKNSNIEGLFKIKEFINNHSSSEKNFLQKFVNSQMFSDFIFKKMLPKNINDKMDILFFDEYINKKSNDKKLFGKKKALYFLTSKEYQYKHTYNVPKVKELSQEEKFRYENKIYKIKNLYLGQDIEIEYNKDTEEFDYFFNYLLFPVLNNDYFYATNYDYYFPCISNDIDRINTDILSKSHLDSIEEDDAGMQNYIYLAYVEIWGYSYYYQNSNEKEYRFHQLLSILDKVYHHEIELFNLLFESLNKFQESDKIMRLYQKLLSYKITPNSYIYSIISKIIDKDKNQRAKNNKNKIEENKDSNDIDNYLTAFSSNYIKNKYDLFLQRRTFRDETEKNILNDLVSFTTSQICPECGKEIDIESISLNYKNMKKDSLWAQCPLCNKYFLPRLTVKLGNDINTVEESTKITSFILHSPYEVKVNLKETIGKDSLQYLEIEKFKMKYPTLFWSCIWYFRLNKIDYEIMLPYESNIFNQNSENKFCGINIIINKDENKENEKNIINYKKIRKNKCYKYDLIIQDALSFYYSNNKFYKYNLGNIKEKTKIKDMKFNPRRTTSFFNNAKKYYSISEFLNSRKSLVNNNEDEAWKRATVKDKTSNKFLEAYKIDKK